MLVSGSVTKSLNVRNPPSNCPVFLSLFLLSFFFVYVLKPMKRPLSPHSPSLPSLKRVPQTRRGYFWAEKTNTKKRQEKTPWRLEKDVSPSHLPRLEVSIGPRCFNESDSFTSIIGKGDNPKVWIIYILAQQKQEKYISTRGKGHGE